MTRVRTFVTIFWHFWPSWRQLPWRAYRVPESMFLLIRSGPLIATIARHTTQKTTVVTFEAHWWWIVLFFAWSSRFRRL